ncbi:MAG: hypothetical protein JSR76_07410, partial [Verrucomicrobia bacterium]|nr:hypothetical protein [Verrucomicrobiota bacterium]
GGAITLSPLEAISNDLRTVILNAGTGQITVASIDPVGNSEFALLSFTGGDIILTDDIVSEAITFSSTSGHTIYLHGNLTTVNNPLEFPVPVVLDSGVAVSITTGGGSITFNDTVDGNTDYTQSLSLNPGAGDLVFTGSVGSAHPLNVITITLANDITANAITAASLLQVNGTGLTSFNGAINLDDVVGLSLTGQDFLFTDAVTTTNMGSVVITNSGLFSMTDPATFTIDGAFRQLGAGGVESGNTITSGDLILFTGPVVITGAATLHDSSSNNQSITFKSTVDGPGNLNLICGTGNVIFEGNVGDTTTLGAFVITSAANVTIQAFAAASMDVTWTAGIFTFNDAVTTNGALGITLVGHDIMYNGSVTTSNGGPITLTTDGTTTGTPKGPLIASGSFTQNSAGASFLGGIITSLTGDITLGHSINLTKATVLTVSGGTITCNSTIAGNFPITFVLGGGDLLLQDDLNVTVLTITNANDVTTKNITAASISQTGGTGTTDFQGNVTTTAPLGISLATKSVTRGGNITTGMNGPLTITLNNSGTFTSTAAGSITLDGAFTQAGSGSNTVAGSLITTNDNIQFAGPITLTGNMSLNSGTGAGNIVLSSTVQGAFNVTLASGTGNITLGGDVGTSIAPIAVLSLPLAANVTIQGVYASSISQGSGTGTLTANGPIVTTGALGIAMIGSGYTFNGAITTNNLGPFSVQHSGLLTFNAGATATIASTFTESGGGSVQLSNALTAGGAVQLHTATTIVGTASVDSSGNSITFFSTIEGPGSITLTAGAGDILVQGASIGATTRVGAFTVVSAANLTLPAIRAASLNQTNGTALTSLQGTVDVNGALGIDLSGFAFAINVPVTATAGPMMIAHSDLLTMSGSHTITLAGAFTESGGGAVSLGSEITTTGTGSLGDISFTGDITLLASVTLDSSAGGGAITLGAVDGNQSLTVGSGSGNITVSGDIGANTALGAILVTSVHDLSVEDLTALSLTQLAASGTNTLTGDLTTTGPDGINLTGTNFIRVGAIVTQNGGSLVVTNSGFITGVMLNTTSIDGSYTQNGTGPVNLAGTITTNNGPISFSGPITLVAVGATLNAGTTGANITFSNTITGAKPLNLTAGSGDIAFGNTVTIGALTINSARNVTTTQALSLDSLLITTSTAATFNASLATTTSSGIVVNGSSFTFNGNVTTTNNGPLTITNTGVLTVPTGVTLSLDGPFTQTGGGSNFFGGSLTTTNDAISFAGALTLTANSVISSGAGAGNISFGSTINGLRSLSITAGTGNLTFSGAIGASNALTSLTVVSANTLLLSNTVSVSGAYTVSSATTSTYNGALSAGSISLSGGAIAANASFTTTSGNVTITNSGALAVGVGAPITSFGSFTQTGGGSVSLGANVTATNALAFGGAITLTNGATLQTTNSNITLSSTVTGSFPLTFIAGTGDITLSGAIGATRLTSLTINTAHDVTALGISAGFIRQLAGTGLTTFNGPLNTNSATGIALTGAKFTINNTVTTTNTGALTIANSDDLTLGASSALTLDSAFNQTGVGHVKLGGSTTTNNANITYNAPVAVLLATNLTSNGGNILFSSTLDGPACPTIVAGAGNVTFNGLIGSITAMGCLNASGATISQNFPLQSTGPVQETGSVAVLVDGNITTQGSAIA